MLLPSFQEKDDYRSINGLPSMQKRKPSFLLTHIPFRVSFENSSYRMCSSFFVPMESGTILLSNPTMVQLIFVEAQNGKKTSGMPFLSIHTTLLSGQYPPARSIYRVSLRELIEQMMRSSIDQNLKEWKPCKIFSSMLIGISSPTIHDEHPFDEAWMERHRLQNFQKVLSYSTQNNSSISLLSS